MVSAGKKSYKYFIGYKDDDKKKPLCTMFSKASTYLKSNDAGTKWMYFLLKIIIY